MKASRGFTLIELLVVIAIIGLLSSVVLASLNTARGKARDAKRLSDIHQIQLALELYYSTYGQYPDAVSSGGCGGWQASGSDTNFIAALKTAGVLPSGVHDPLASTEGSCGNYAYYRYVPGSSGCNSARGYFYVLGIRSSDKAGTAVYSGSPGWSCPSRDWQVEFSWVTGGFEN